MNDGAGAKTTGLPMIKFACPHCKKTLQVKDRLAGKRGQCPGCKKMVMVPAQTVSAGSSSGPLDLEALAAAAVSEGPQKEAEAPARVKFTCTYCDAEVEVSAELSGRQAPCPECARIVKVPRLEKSGPRDWRQPDAQVGPSGARRDAAALEGAWGTESKATVSRQALVEADAAPEVRPRRTRLQKILPVLSAVFVAGVLFGVGYWTWSWFKGRGEAGAVASVEKFLSEEGKGLTLEMQAELNRAVGEHYLRSGAQEAGGERHTKGWRQLQLAGQSPGRVTDPIERHAVLRELLRTQTLLAQAPPETEPQQAAQRFVQEANKALAQVQPGMPRAEVVRELARWAVKNGKEGELRLVIRQSIQAAEPARLDAGKPGKASPGKPAQPSAPAGLDFSEQTSCLAILGQELVKAGQTDIARRLAQDLQRGWHADHAFPRGLMVLQVMLKQPTAELENYRDQEAVRATRMEGQARAGDWSAARQSLAELREPTLTRLDALVTLAEVLVESQTGAEALPVLQDAAQLIERHLDASWHQLRVVELAAAAGEREAAARLLFGFQRLPAPPSTAAQGRARLAILRAELAARPDEPCPPGRLQEVSSSLSAQALAAERIARQNARSDFRDALRWAESVEPAALRPFAVIGAVLGRRDQP